MKKMLIEIVSNNAVMSRYGVITGYLIFIDPTWLNEDGSICYPIKYDKQNIFILIRKEDYIIIND